MIINSMIANNEKLNSELNKKLLVLYVFHEYNYRVEQFFKKAIFYDKNVDFIIIVNNITLKLQYNAFPSNVKFFIRDNIGFDFGGWSDALLTNNLYKNYNYFIFVNSSVLGPFIDSDYKGNWTDIFINGLQENNIKLFGSTINKDFHPHVQTFIFSLEKETLEYLIKWQIFSLTNHYEKLWDTVMLKEIFMSDLLIRNKWNIGCLIPYYKNMDFVKLVENKEVEKFMINGHLDCKCDIMYNEFYKIHWTETDIIFFKGNRDIILR